MSVSCLSAGVLYFVSTTVNPILYNVLSRKYRQAFKMTLCNACMDDATRQRLQRDGFGALTVYYSTARGSSNPVPPRAAADPRDKGATSKRRNGGRAAVVVVGGRTHLLQADDSVTGNSTSTSAGSRTPFTARGVRFHNGAVAGVSADTSPRRIRLMTCHAAVVSDGMGCRQLLEDRLPAPGGQTGSADDSPVEPEESRSRMCSESAHVEI